MKERSTRHPEVVSMSVSRASIEQHMAETEPTAKYSDSDPLQSPGIHLPWCLPHVYSLWAESEHGARLVDIREANGAVGHGPSIQK